MAHDRRFFSFAHPNEERTNHKNSTSNEKCTHCKQGASAPIRIPSGCATDRQHRDPINMQRQVCALGFSILHRRALSASSHKGPFRVNAKKSKQERFGMYTTCTLRQTNCIHDIRCDLGMRTSCRSSEGPGISRRAFPHGTGAVKGSVSRAVSLHALPCENTISCNDEAADQSTPFSR